MTSFLLNVGRSQKIMWFREKDYSSITFQTCSLWWGRGHWEFWERKCLDPQGTEGIHSVSAPEGHASGLLGAGMSKPPKIHLPKVEPFSEGVWWFCPFPPTSLPFPLQSHKLQLVHGQRSFLEVSPLGAVSGMWKAGDWLQKGWMPVCPCQEHWSCGAGGTTTGELPLSSRTLLLFPMWWGNNV